MPVFLIIAGIPFLAFFLRKTRAFSTMRSTIYRHLSCEPFEQKKGINARRLSTSKLFRAHVGCFYHNAFVQQIIFRRNVYWATLLSFVSFTAAELANEDWRTFATSNFSPRSCRCNFIFNVPSSFPTYPSTIYDGDDVIVIFTIISSPRWNFSFKISEAPAASQLLTFSPLRSLNGLQTCSATNS